MAEDKSDTSLDDDSEYFNKVEDLDEQQAETKSEENEFDFDQIDRELSNIPSWTDDQESEQEEGYTLNYKETYMNSLEQDAKDLAANNVDTEPDGFADSSTGEISVLIEQRDGYLEALRQLQADFENYKKRVIRDQQDDAHEKSAKLMEDLLPVIDNFQLALDNIEGKDTQTKKIRKGIELVYADLISVLERQGLEHIEADGALFDPELHDAVQHEDNGEHDQEIVTEVLRPGYKVRGRVVRPAMVKVAK